MGNCAMCGSGNKVNLQTSSLPDGVVLIDESNKEEAVQVAARSFCGTADSDPEFILNWAWGPHLDGKWEEQGRLELLSWLMRLMIRDSLSYGGLCLATKQEDGSLGAVCITHPYLGGKKPPGNLKSMWRYMANMRELGEPPFAKKPMKNDIGSAIEKRLDVLGKLMMKLHHKHAPGDHWYVKVMAVDPINQGKGLCGKLMRAVNTMADALYIPCYLETGGQRNVNIYKRFGYVDVEQFTVDKPDDVDQSKPYEDAFIMVRPKLSPGTE